MGFTVINNPRTASSPHPRAIVNSMAPPKLSRLSVTEVTPLLGAVSDDLVFSSSTAPTQASVGINDILRAHWKKWSYLYWHCLFGFLVDFGPFMAEGARIRMIELGICRDHYATANSGVIESDGSVPEELCEIGCVQSELAKMKGFMSLISGIPGLLLAVPYGLLTDSRGRRLVVALGLSGLILSEGFLLMVLYFYEVFPLRAVYVAPAFFAIGGGPVVSIDDQAITPACEAVLQSDRKSNNHLTGMMRFIRDDLRLLFRETALLISILCLVIQKLARPMLDMLLQYMSVKFKWSLSKAMYIVSLQAAVQIALYLWVVPQVYRWLLRRRKNNVTVANLALARLCISFLAIGALGMDVAPATPAFVAAVLVYTCGTSYPEAVRSFLTGLVDKSRITTLYTAMALVGGVTFAASPLLGLTLSAGIGKGGVLAGLPLLVAASIYVAACIGVWIIRIKPQR
ncbi:hypothetical protein BJ170DRAFT_682172 [Xylariales sp. AK1849]|nr:hypothetical protein BJ170DRAFT_682172 [Xylariales sp. AK1849]